MTFEDLVIMARTVYGEARGESGFGKRAVAHVILNRTTRHYRKASTVSAVCLDPYQFSCWLPNDTNRLVVERANLDLPGFANCMKACLEALDEPDITHGSTHYKRHDVKANWAKGKEPVKVIGDHEFFNTVD